MPKFLTNTDFEFMQHINREIAGELVENLVILYKININYSKINIYGESLEKVMYTPIELPASIDYVENTAISEGGFGVDQEQNINFGFVRRILEERHVYPEIGDIIKYDENFYEIDNVIETQLIAGRPEYNHSIRCPAHLTRRSSIQIEERQL